MPEIKCDFHIKHGKSTRFFIAYHVVPSSTSLLEFKCIIMHSSWDDLGYRESLWAFYDLICFAPINKNPKTPDQNKEIHLKRVYSYKHYTQQWSA